MNAKDLQVPDLEIKGKKQHPVPVVLVPPKKVHWEDQGIVNLKLDLVVLVKNYLYQRIWLWVRIVLLFWIITHPTTQQLGALTKRDIVGQKLLSKNKFLKIYIYCPFSFTDLGRSREDIDKHRDLDKESMLSLSASGLGKPDLANYVPNQRLEWKRYKQYTRNDIMAAIEEVKSGMKFFLFLFY